jgi:nicotinamidase/pyrazinamidase
LPVPGATADMDRFAALITNQGDYMDAVHVTLDSHHTNDIAHPGYWACPCAPDCLYGEW